MRRTALNSDAVEAKDLEVPGPRRLSAQLLSAAIIGQKQRVRITSFSSIGPGVRGKEYGACIQALSNLLDEEFDNNWIHR